MGKDITNNYGYTKDGNDEDDYDDEESTSEGKDVTNNYGYAKDGNDEDDNDDNMSVEENTNFLDSSFDTDEGDIGEMDGSADVGEDDQDISLQKLIKYYRGDEILSDNDENNGEGFLLDMDGGDDENDGSSNVGDAGLAW